MAQQSHHHHGSGDPQAYVRVLEGMNGFQEREGRQAIADLGLAKGSRGLDVGCGVGLYTLWLAEAVGAQGHVLGIEPSAERVETARHFLGERLDPQRITLRVGDGRAIDVPAQSFDWLWCSDVLHHIDDGVAAVREFLRVLRPGGQLIIKESQVSPGLFLPGHLELERQLQRAEIQCNRAEAGERSFQERRQRTAETLYAAGVQAVTIRTYMVQRQAPLDGTSLGYIRDVIFARNWGLRLRGFLAASDWEQRCQLCEADSPQSILARPDYYCLYPLTLFVAQAPVEGRRA